MDISVNRIVKVSLDANARFSATYRTYKYYISRKKNPFTEGSAWYIHGDLDIDSMNKAASCLLRVKDFTSFAKLHSDTSTNLCKINHAEWIEKDDQLIFLITADRFLRNMVRAIVGTLVEVGRHKIGLSEFNKIIKDKNRCSAGKSAPAKGLFLEDIGYPPEIFSI